MATRLSVKKGDDGHGLNYQLSLLKVCAIMQFELKAFLAHDLISVTYAGR